MAREDGHHVGDDEGCGRPGDQQEGHEGHAAEEAQHRARASGPGGSDRGSRDGRQEGSEARRAERDGVAGAPGWGTKQRAGGQGEGTPDGARAAPLTFALRSPRRSGYLRNSGEPAGWTPAGPSCSPGFRGGQRGPPRTSPGQSGRRERHPPFPSFPYFALPFPPPAVRSGPGPVRDLRARGWVARDWPPPRRAERAPGQGGPEAKARPACRVGVRLSPKAPCSRFCFIPPPLEIASGFLEMISFLLSGVGLPGGLSKSQDLKVMQGGFESPCTKGCAF